MLDYMQSKAELEHGLQEPRALVMREALGVLRTFDEELRNTLLQASKLSGCSCSSWVNCLLGELVNPFRRFPTARLTRRHGLS